LLADLLAKRGDIDELRARANAGDDDAAYQVACLLADQNKLDELRAWADGGNASAREVLAHLLIEHGDFNGAVQALRSMADIGPPWHWARDELADLLARQEDVDGLRARSEAGDWPAADRLADLLAHRRDFEGAIRSLPHHPRHGQSPDRGSAC
jgi:hypothetical protein